METKLCSEIDSYIPIYINLSVNRKMHYAHGYQTVIIFSWPPLQLRNTKSAIAITGAIALARALECNKSLKDLK